MRQGQQNRRGRGRNRKGQSPLTRSFESTGPDVKIRGTPAHIAEKYMSLARDASSSGDPVLAENYLQHAEHYNRIIMAFRDQHMGPGGEQQMNGGMGRNRPFMSHDPMDPGDEYGDDDADEGDAQPGQGPMRQHEPQPKPRMDGQRFEGQRGGHDQHRYRDRHGGDQRGYRPPRQQSADAGAEGGPQQPAPEGQRGERLAQTHEQPEFLRRPVRRPRREGNGAPGETNGGVAEETDHD
jgi:Domain of unknown function (DUF4167)